MTAQLTRDASRVHANLYELEDGSIHTRVPCTIQIPERYLGRHLASIGLETHILGFFALIMEGRYYAVSRTTAMMRITPSATHTVEVNGEKYLEFHFKANSRVFYSTALVKTGTLAYYIYDELVAKGRVPWYFNYFDMVQMFDTAQLHAGVNLGSRSILGLIISTMARDAKDYTVLYRHTLRSAEDVEKRPPAIVPFSSVVWNTTDSASRLIGAYFDDSLNSALVNPSDSVERVEELLRS